MTALSPQVVLGTANLTGNRSNESGTAADFVGRFQTPMEIASVFNDAAAAGVDAVATLNQLDVLAALKKTRQTFPALQVYPIIPNVIGYVREATDYGLVGAARRRVRQMALVDLLKIGIRGALKAPGVLKRDFNTLMSILFEVELASFKSLEPRVVFLHPQITDLALAFGNRSLFELYLRVMRERFHTEPGLATNNLGWLLPRLKEWNLTFPFLLTPFNPSGFLMKPSRADCEALVTSIPSAVIADKVDSGAGPTQDTWGYLRRHNIRAAVIEFWDDASLAANIRDAKKCLAA
jgi:hypothetical protein